MSDVSRAIDEIRSLGIGGDASDRLRAYARYLARDAHFEEGEEVQSIRALETKAKDLGVSDDPEILDAIGAIDKIKQDGW